MHHTSLSHLDWMVALRIYDDDPDFKLRAGEGREPAAPGAELPISNLPSDPTGRAGHLLSKPGSALDRSGHSVFLPEFSCQCIQIVEQRCSCYAKIGQVLTQCPFLRRRNSD